MTDVPAKLLGVSLLTLLAFAALPAITVSAAPADQYKASAFIEIAERARDLLVRLRDHAEAEGIGTSSVDLILTDGDTHLDAARTAYEENPPNYPLAEDEARNAARIYREGLQQLGALLGSAIEDENYVGQGLLEAIEAHRRRADVMAAIAAGVAENEGNAMYIGWVLDNVTEAHTHLNVAEAAITNSPPNASEAAQELAAADQDLQEAAQALRELARMYVVERLTDFVSNVLQGLVDLAQRALDRAAEHGADPAEVAEIQEMINGAAAAIQAGVVNVQTGQPEEGLEQFSEARQLLIDALGQIAQLWRA